MGLDFFMCAADKNEMLVCEALDVFHFFYYWKLFKWIGRNKLKEGVVILDF